MRSPVRGKGILGATYKIYDAYTIPDEINGDVGEEFKIHVWFGIDADATVWTEVVGIDGASGTWNLTKGGWAIDFTVKLKEKKTSNFTLTVRGGVVEDSQPYIHDTKDVLVKVRGVPPPPPEEKEWWEMLEPWQWALLGVAVIGAIVLVRKK